MKVPQDIAELLRAGMSDRAIALQLHTNAKTVASCRVALHLPKTGPGRRRAARPEDLFWSRVRPTDDGHMEWTGFRSKSGVPAVRHGGTLFTAHRLAFRIANRRDPEGKTLPTCGHDRCVAPAHQGDRVRRAEDRKVDGLYAAIFGDES